MITALITLILGAYLLWNEKKTKIIFLFLLAGLLAFSASGPLFTYANTVNYATPEIDVDYNSVCFDLEHSGINITPLPVLGLYNDIDEYTTFYVWTQRVGCIPSMEDSLESSLEGDLVVIINPNEHFTSTEIKSLTDFVEDGGKLLILEGMYNEGSTAKELCYAELYRQNWTTVWKINRSQRSRTQQK